MSNEIQTASNRRRAASHRPKRIREGRIKRIRNGANERRTKGTEGMGRK